MPHLIWSDDLNTGIEAIDSQHKCIVDHINQLHDARFSTDRTVAENVIDAIVDHTHSHFGFEESLMEETGYEFTRAHKQVHELFIRRIDELHQRFRNNENILDELENMLIRWILNHIKNDDASYVEAIMQKTQAENSTEKGWLSKQFEKFLRSNMTSKIFGE